MFNEESQAYHGSTMSNYTGEREKPSAIEGTTTIEHLKHVKSCLENAPSLSGELQARDQDTLAIASSSSPRSLEHAVSGSSLGGDDCSAHRGGDDCSAHGGSSISRTSSYGPAISATPSTSSLSEIDIPDYYLSPRLQEKHKDCMLISHSSSMEGAKKLQEYAQKNVVMPDGKKALVEFMDDMCLYVGDKFDQLTETLKFTTKVYVICTKKLFEDEELKANVRAALVANLNHHTNFVPVYLCERDKTEVERSQYHIGIKVPIAFYENAPTDPDFLKLLTKRITVGFGERMNREENHEREKREEKKQIHLRRQREELGESGDGESDPFLARELSSVSLESTDDAMFKQPVPSASGQFTNGADNSSTAQSVAHQTPGGASGYTSPGGAEQSLDRCYSGLSYPAMDEPALSRIVLEARDVPVIQRGWAESRCTTSLCYTTPRGQAPCTQQAGSSRDVQYVVTQRVQLPVSVRAVTYPGPPPTSDTLRDSRVSQADGSSSASRTADHATSATTSGAETPSVLFSLHSTGGPYQAAGVATRATEDSSPAQPFYIPADEKTYSPAQSMYEPPDGQHAAFPPCQQPGLMGPIDPKITTSMEMAGRQRVEGSGDTASVAASDGSGDLSLWSDNCGSVRSTGQLLPTNANSSSNLAFYQATEYVQALPHQQFPSRPLDASQTNPTGSYPDYGQLRQQPPSSDQPQSLQDQVTLLMEQVQSLSVQHDRDQHELQMLRSRVLYPGQVVQGQPYVGQSYQGQLYQGQVQPYLGQLYQGQVIQGQPYVAQSCQGQVTQAKPIYGQATFGQPFQQLTPHLRGGLPDMHSPGFHRLHHSQPDLHASAMPRVAEGAMPPHFLPQAILPLGFPLNTQQLLQAQATSLGMLSYPQQQTERPGQQNLQQLQAPCPMEQAQPQFMAQQLVQSQTQSDATSQMSGTRIQAQAGPPGPQMQPQTQQIGPTQQRAQSQPLASSAHWPAADPAPVYQNQPLAFPEAAQFPPPDRPIASRSSTAERPEPSAVSQPSQTLSSACVSHDEQQKVLLRE